MNVHVLRPNDLDSNHVALWSRWQDEDPVLQSPYFCLEFIRTVGEARRDVFVGVIEEDGCVAGFFPFQRSRLGFGRPVGAMLSDFHGIIAPRSASWDAHELLDQCGLVSWEFHHLPAEQATFRARHQPIGPSHFIDLSRGFEGYADDLRRAGSHLLKDVLAKRRRTEREFGEVRLVPHVADPAVLRTLLEWKSRQYQHSGLTDLFALPWARELIERLHAMQSGCFAGMLSALYARDQIVALHFGMRSRTVLNWWFPRHDERFDRNSPGIMLRLAVAEAMVATGLQRIDLGLGSEASYKPRLANGAIELVEGRVEAPSLVMRARQCRINAERWVRQSPFVGIARIPGRLLVRVEDWLKTR